MIITFANQLLLHFHLLLVVLFCLSQDGSNYGWSRSFRAIQSVSGWDIDGHQAIGMTAMSALVGETTSHVKRLMGGKDVVDVAGWANRVEIKYPKTTPFHFQYQTIKSDCVQAAVTDLNCPKNQCLVRVLQHFYGRLTGRPNLVQLDYPDGVQLTDSDAMKFLINLMGDLHHPMHFGFAEDLGGQNMTFVYSDSRSEKKQTTAFNYWDSALVQKFIKERPAFWYGGWTHSHSLGDRLNELRREWEDHDQETRHLLFEQWATESLHLACNNIYKDPRSGAIIPSGYEVGSTYEFTAMELLKRQILVAGARTGFILNTILSGRDAAKLRQGSGVEVPLEDESLHGNLSVPSQRYFKSFCINFVIIVVVLGVFAYVSRFYSPTSTQSVGAGTRSVSTSKPVEKTT